MRNIRLFSTFTSVDLYVILLLVHVFAPVFVQNVELLPPRQSLVKVGSVWMFLLVKLWMLFTNAQVVLLWCVSGDGFRKCLKLVNKANKREFTVKWLILVVWISANKHLSPFHLDFFTLLQVPTSHFCEITFSFYRGIVKTVAHQLYSCLYLPKNI